MSDAVDPTLGLKQNFAREDSREHVLLSAAFLIAYMALASIGRDVFFNGNTNFHKDDDVIGYYLPYIRVAACAFAIAVVTTTAGLTWAFSKVPLLFAPYCLYALASCVWSVDIKDSLRGAFTLVAAWLAMTMIIHRLGVVQAVRLSLYLIAWVCIASCLLAVFLPAIGRHNDTDLLQAGHVGQWRGIFSHKNGLGPWAAYGAAMLLFYGRLLRSQPLFRWSSWVCACLCLIFAGSVTSFLLSGFCVVLVFVLKGLRHLPPSWVLLAVAVVGALGACAAFAESEWIFAAVGRDASFSGRWDIWKFTFGYIVERPLFGYGYQTLGGDEFLARERMVFLQPIPGPESGYVDLLLEQGAVGFVLFFVPYIASIRNGFEWLKYVQREDGEAIGFYLIVLISTLMEGFSETNSLTATGYDGVICFGAFFALLTAPKSPPTGYRSRARRWAPAPPPPTEFLDLREAG